MLAIFVRTYLYIHYSYIAGPSNIKQEDIEQDFTI